MKLQKATTTKFRSSRVKALDKHSTKPLIVSGLYNGYIQTWDTQTKTLNESFVSEYPIRSVRLVEKNDCVLVGTDEGKIYAYDLGNLRKLYSFDAHNDFVRKIEIHPLEDEFLSCSDDGTIKRWRLGKDVKNLGTYSGHNHFVMDVKYYPKDNSKFISCSLDGTIKLWDVVQNKAIKTYKGHVNGINCITFIPNGDYFASGSDDLSIKIWDINNTNCISTLTGHSENIVNLKVFKNNLVSCSEDGSIKIWDSKSFQLSDTLRLGSGRVWDFVEKGSTFVIGTDENLIFMDVKSGFILSKLRHNKGFYAIQNQVFSCKLDSDFYTPKLLSELDWYPEELEVSENGKLVALVGDNSFTLYSSLGFRKKLEGSGSSFSFTSNTDFVVLEGDNLNFYNKNEITKSMKIENVRKIFWLEDCFVGVFENTSTFYDTTGNELGFLEYPLKSISQFNNYFVVAKENNLVILRDFEIVKEFNYRVESFSISDNIYIFTSGTKIYYLLIGNLPFITPLVSTNGIILGRIDYKIYYLEDSKIKMVNLDKEFLNFQLEVLSNPDSNPNLSESLRLKAIAFYESLEMFDKALEICTNENYKFEILIKLNMFKEALAIADSPLKYNKLAYCFLKTKNLKKASECFFKAKDFKNLLFVDLLGDKKYLDEIYANCQKEGWLNYALIAILKKGDYKRGAELLKDTPFYNIFLKTHFK